MHSRRIASVMVLAAAAAILLSAREADADGRRYRSFGSRRHRSRGYYHRPRGTGITVYSPRSRYAVSGYYGRKPYVTHITPYDGYSSRYRPSSSRYRYRPYSYRRGYHYDYPSRYSSPRHRCRRHHGYHHRHRSHCYPRRRSGIGISISGVFSSLLR